jgi:hypothetical protein
MSALFNDVHNDVATTTTTPDVNDVKLSDLIAGKRDEMLAAFRRHTSYDVDDMPDTTEDGTPIPPWAYTDEQDLNFDPWIG